MSNWIINNFGIKGLLILLVGLIVLIASFVGPPIYRRAKILSYDGTAKAQITNITEKKMSFQDMSGGSVKTIGYDLTYTFTVDSTIYTRSENQKPSYDVARLFDAFNSGQACFIEVKYLSNNPQKSLISKVFL
jgi:hypothetical protein